MLTNNQFLLKFLAVNKNRKLYIVTKGNKNTHKTPKRHLSREK